MIVGRSNIVGKPMAMLMLGENATVTFATQRQKICENDMPQSGYFICAIGKPQYFTKGLRQRGRGCD